MTKQVQLISVAILFFVILCVVMVNRSYSPQQNMTDPTKLPHPNASMDQIYSITIDGLKASVSHCKWKGHSLHFVYSLEYLQRLAPWVIQVDAPLLVSFYDDRRVQISQVSIPLDIDGFFLEQITTQWQTVIQVTAPKKTVRFFTVALGGSSLVVSFVEIPSAD